MGKKNNKNNPKNTNKQQVFWETKNEKIRSYRKPSIPKDEEDYCNKANQSHQPKTYPKIQR